MIGIVERPSSNLAQQFSKQLYYKQVLTEIYALMADCVLIFCHIRCTLTLKWKCRLLLILLFAVQLHQKEVKSEQKMCMLARPTHVKKPEPWTTQALKVVRSTMFAVNNAMPLSADLGLNNIHRLKNSIKIGVLTIHCHEMENGT